MILLLSRHARTGGGSNGYDLNDHGHSCMLLAFTIRQWCNRAAVSLSPAKTPFSVWVAQKPRRNRSIGRVNSAFTLIADGGRGGVSFGRIGTFSPGARLEPFLLLDAVTSGGGSGLLLAHSMLTACDAV